MAQRRVLVPVPAVLAIVLLAAVSSAAFAQDVVQVTNGDRITGDIEGLERGSLEFGTAAAGTLEIDWDEVVRLTSTTMLDVELSNGMRYSGTLTSPADGQVIVQTASGPTMPIALSDIARIRVVAATFVERTSGSVDFGFAVTSHSTSYTLIGNALNRTRSFETELDVESRLLRQEDEDSETRNDILLKVKRLLSRRWFASALAQVEEDDELELDWRVLLGGGVGRWLVDTNDMQLSLEGGLDYNSESYTSAEGTDHSAEVFGDVDWHWSPDGHTEVTTKAKTEVSLDRKRVRLDFHAQLRRDAFRSLYWSVSTFDDFDSDPPDDRPRSSLGLAIGLGWSF
jgi:hypothetical protein